MLYDFSDETGFFIFGSGFLFHLSDQTVPLILIIV